MYGDVHQCDPNIHKQKLTGWCSGVSMLYRHQLYHPQWWRYRHNGWNELSDTRQTTVISIQYADIVQCNQNKMQARDSFKFILRKEICSLLNTLLCRTAAKAISIYVKLCRSAMLDSISCSFTSIYFLTSCCISLFICILWRCITI
jgi:hypothetical protein